MAYQPATTLKVKEQRDLFPPKVLQKVEAYKKRYRCRKVYFRTHEPGYQIYLAEGASYTLVSEDGKESKDFNMQSEFSLHAGGEAISYCVGQKSPAIPAGWIVEFELFCGKPMIEVHHVQATIS